MGLFKKFLPKEEKFMEFLSNLMVNIHDGAGILHEMQKKFENFGEYSSRISILEHKCDDIIHSLNSELNETFVTPIDREDIYHLAQSLDNIMDSMDVIGTRICLYKVKNKIDFGVELSDILLQQTNILAEVVKNLENYKVAYDKLISVRKLESDGDVVFRRAISELFENEKDVVELIKKKEILEIFEKAIDRCQTASIVAESILIKNV
jgi:uncharacterized protein